ncbi:MAG TPA: hypothetical protein PLS67_11700, partial [Accumulibacter sp.]|nr:hypothetical protein [Accumulibacter sp.]
KTGGMKSALWHTKNRGNLTHLYANLMPKERRHLFFCASAAMKGQVLVADHAGTATIVPLRFLPSIKKKRRVV